VEYPDYDSDEEQQQQQPEPFDLEAVNRRLAALGSGRPSTPISLGIRSGVELAG
jgi:hypothetical protein